MVGKIQFQFPNFLEKIHFLRFISFILACPGAKWIYNEDGESGRLEFWNENGYHTNLNCYFKIEVPESVGRTISPRKIKLHFEAFDFGPGYNYDISLSSDDPELIVEGGRFPKRGKFYHNLKQN